MTDFNGTKYTHLERYRPIVKDEDGNEVFYQSKLERKLDRQGSLYGRVSLVSQTFNDIQKCKFKEMRTAK